MNNRGNVRSRYLPIAHLLNQPLVEVGFNLVPGGAPVGSYGPQGNNHQSKRGLGAARALIV